MSALEMVQALEIEKYRAIYDVVHKKLVLGSSITVKYKLRKIGGKQENARFTGILTEIKKMSIRILKPKTNDGPSGIPIERLFPISTLGLSIEIEKEPLRKQRRSVLSFLSRMSGRRLTDQLYKQKKLSVTKKTEKVS